MQLHSQTAGPCAVCQLEEGDICLWHEHGSCLHTQHVHRGWPAHTGSHLHTHRGTYLYPCLGRETLALEACLDQKAPDLVGRPWYCSPTG